MGRGLVITWDNNPSSAVPELTCLRVDRNLLGAVRDEAVEMAGAVDGAYVFADTRGNREISAQVTVIDSPAAGARRGSVGDAAAWLDKTGYRQLKFSDQPDRYWEAYLQSAPPVSEWRQRGDFPIVWSAKPYAYSVSLSSQCVSALTDPDTDTFTITDPVGGACPVLEITPLDGTVTGYTLTVNTYELVVASASIANGQTQTVSACTNTIYGGAYAEAELNGAYVPTPLWSVDADGEFPLLVTGTNSWTFDWDGTATQVQLCFYWRERLL